HSDRRKRRRDAAASSRHSSGNRHERRPTERGASGAYSGATERFFAWGPPWRKLLVSAPRKSGLPVFRQGGATIKIKAAWLKAGKSRRGGSRKGRRLSREKACHLAC